MKGLLSLISDTLRTMADIVENRNQKNAGDFLSDVDDQRAHHFGSPVDFNELDDFVENKKNELC